MENIRPMAFWCVDCKEAFTVYGGKDFNCPYCCGGNYITISQKKKQLSNRAEKLENEISVRNNNQS